MIRKFFWVFVGCLIAQYCSAAVFQWTDGQGRKHYSDQSNSQTVELKFTPSYSYYAVKKVYDGDTVQLRDGRKIRLLAINTPEVEHNNQVAQAGGEAAKKWLIKTLKGKKIRLEFDQERRDKYKRHLAHIFTDQGEHINYELVRLGYASVNVFPPNLKYIPELMDQQQIAESQQRGIWGESEYKIKSINQIKKANSKGWQRISGTVSAIKFTSKSVYLKFIGNFEVRIKKEHLKFFGDVQALKGQKVEVRGWLNRSKKGFKMLVKHPSALNTL